MTLSKNTQGIYELRNLTNGRRYVGSSKDIRARFWNHRSMLRGGTHPNKDLLADWSSLGANAFDFCVVAVLEHADLRPTEQRLLDANIRDGISCYNYFQHVTSPTAGRPLTDKHKEKLSLALTGRALSDETRRGISTTRLGKKYPRPAMRQHVAITTNSIGE